VGAVGATMLAGLKLSPGRSLEIWAAGFAAIGLVALGSVFDMRLGRAASSASDQAALFVAGALLIVLAVGVVSALAKCFSVGVLGAVCNATMSITAMIFATLIGATLFALVFRGLGGEEMIKEFLSVLPGGTYGALGVVMAVIFVMGFFLDFVEITIIVIPIVGPILLGMGIDPIWLGVLIALNLQTSFLTPPFGFALFYLAGVAKDLRTMDIYKGIIPFVIIQLFAVLIVVLFPGLATWLPKLLF
jgi:TRAP-type mannitol/chloroaromatic compound transport system permease large subunit